jgi:hypothetical protein
VVDDKDYLAVIANMGSTNGQWFLGDLNGDGIVNVDDFAEVTAHLGNGVSGPAAQMAAAKTAGVAAGADTGGTSIVRAAAAKRAPAKTVTAVAKGKAKKEKGKTPKLAQRH